MAQHVRPGGDSRLGSRDSLSWSPFPWNPKCEKGPAAHGAREELSGKREKRLGDGE